MTTNDERAEDPAAARRPADELPGQLPFDRLDVGDAEQLAELTGTDGPPVEEQRQPVDEPRRPPPPYDRAHKRRNQRPLPT
ncbi:hypothetical protein ACGFKZ_09535 [Micromonospora tulbaghiae]|uniref:Uncharacterized protein n=1 Tax=Micromonospora tulbaghiae TaxID=479978 RepID=A0A386WTN2_9ACTN|nr:MULTISPECIES: hypothetical protein [Micromonospora]AYF31333.1 hypothetical protein CSH63_28590 [Micromonospora tulbaghiae]MCO1613815.1 hypothetical protein [Micromonospora sp. CPM1]NED55885.1 hypothetical protein [Micromonospora aurantiaca]RLP97941.1 hypothetical protein EAD96_29110 [Micromonospora sp. BL1]